MLTSYGIKDNEMTRASCQQPSADNESWDRLGRNYNPASVRSVLASDDITSHTTLFLFP